MTMHENQTEVTLEVLRESWANVQAAEGHQRSRRRAEHAQLVSLRNTQLAQARKAAEIERGSRGPAYGGLRLA